MRFLIDAQLPRRLSHEVTRQGHDAIHTLDLPNGNQTPDQEIIHFAVNENRIMVTKDSDFVASYLLSGLPPKLLLVSTGNTSNEQLSTIFTATLVALEDAFQSHSFVELGKTIITIHG